MSNGQDLMAQIFGQVRNTTGSELGIANSDMFNSLQIGQYKDRVSALSKLPQSFSAGGVVQSNGVAAKSQATLFLMQQTARARLKTMQSLVNMHQTSVNFGVETMKLDETLGRQDLNFQVSGFKYGINQGSMSAESNAWQDAMNAADSMFEVG